MWGLRHHADLVWLDDPRGHDIVMWAASAELDPTRGWPRQAREALRARPNVQAPMPFVSGLVGYVGYECGAEVESMPSPPSTPPLPALQLRRYEGALVRKPDGSWCAAGPRDFVDQAAQAVLQATPPPAPPAARGTETSPDPVIFRDGVRQALRAIHRGDYYQVNLSRRLVFDGVDRPLDVYRRLRRSPASFGAYIAVPGGALLSNSPELFLESRDGRVVSRPIKGTAPLGGDEALERDPKERAELTMIVDLVRNDLGRVCRPGSIQAGPRRVYALPTLVHAEQEVRGQLREGLDAVDLLGATFPPGSVTGAPKVSAMRAIASLEPVARGAYTGCIGYLADGGGAQLSVAIRTASVLGSRAWVHVGCGIVADSDPSRELEESEVKARALRAALSG